MRFYFLSKEQCAVKIDGVFMGIIDGNLSYIDHCGHNFLIEFYPEDKNYAPSSLYLRKTESGFLKSALSIPAEDGYLIFPLFTVGKSDRMRDIFQKSFQDRRIGVSLIADPYYKIVVATENDYFFIEPKYYSDGAKIDCRLSGDLLFLQIGGRHTYLYVFSVAHKVKPLYSEEVSGVEYSDCITITKKPVGATGCKIIEKYSVTDFSLIEKKFERTRSVYALPKELIPFAFLEELRHGGDFSEYLSRALKPDNGLIARFFGNFMFFIPYVSADEIRAALVYEDKVETVSFTLSDDNSIVDFAFV